MDYVGYVLVPPPDHYEAETWEFDGASWFRIVTALSPSTGQDMVYDSARGVVVLYGQGASGWSQTWEYRGP